MKDRTQLKLGVYTTLGFMSNTTREQAEAFARKEKLPGFRVFNSAPQYRRSIRIRKAAVINAQ